MNNDKILELNKRILESENIVVITGAGISTSSGIPDFRGKDGIYTKHPEYADIFDIDSFIKDPRTFYSFYFSTLSKEYSPNIVHKKLKKLEDTGKIKAIITQNIDGLHEKAGSNNIYNLHGSFDSWSCLNCYKKHPLSYVNSQKEKDIARCSCGGILKPDVVFFGENLNNSDLSIATEYIQNADTLICIGTSLTVYPVAGLPRYFSGDNFIILNRDETIYDAYADLVIHDELDNIFSNILIN